MALCSLQELTTLCCLSDSVNFMCYLKNIHIFIQVNNNKIIICILTRDLTLVKICCTGTFHSNTLNKG